MAIPFFVFVIFAGILQATFIVPVQAQWKVEEPFQVVNEDGTIDFADEDGYVISDNGEVYVTDTDGDGVGDSFEAGGHTIDVITEENPDGTEREIIIIDGEEVPIETDGEDVTIVVDGDYDEDGGTTIIIEEEEPPPDIISPELIYPEPIGPETTQTPIIIYPTEPPIVILPATTAPPTEAPPPPATTPNNTCGCPIIINNINKNVIGFKPGRGGRKNVVIKRKGQKQRVLRTGPGVKRRFIAGRNLQRNLAKSSGAGNVKVYRVLNQRGRKPVVMRNLRKRPQTVFRVRPTSKRQGTLSWRKVSPLRAKRLQKLGFTVGKIEKKVNRPGKQQRQLSQNKLMRYRNASNGVQQRTANQNEWKDLGLKMEGRLGRKPAKRVQGKRQGRG